MSEFKTTIFVVKVAAIAISVVSIIGNSLVCHIIVRLKTMKTSINYIILNLALLDAFSGFLTIYYVILEDRYNVLGTSLLQEAYNQSAIFGDILCRLSRWYWFASTVAPILLMAMAYERYKAIVHPFSRLNKTTKTKLKMMLLLAWITGLAYVIVDVVSFKVDVKVMFCFPENGSWAATNIFVLLCLVSQYTIPSITIFFLYIRVICALRKRDNVLGPQAAAEISRRKSRKKVMWIIIVLTLVFYACCAIPNIWQIAIVLDEYQPDHAELISEILVMLLSINSTFNPFVYFFFIQSFRNGFQRVFMSRNFRSDRSLGMSVSHPSVSLDSARRENVDNNNPQLLGIVNTAEEQN